MKSRLVDTRDIDEARRLIADVYCDHQLAVDRSRRPFHAVQTETTAGPVAVHQLTYRSDITASAAPLGSWVLVSSPTRGSLTVRRGKDDKRVGIGEVAVISPEKPFTLLWEDDCKITTVRLRRTAVESAAVAAGWLEGTPLEFSPRAGLGDSGARWNRLVDHVRRSPTALQSGPVSDLVSEALERYLATSLIAELGLRLPDPGPVATVTSLRLKAIVDFMAENCGAPLSVEQISNFAHLSARALHESFRRHLDTTPAALLRDLRLMRVNRILSEARTGDDITVAAVASQYGFGNHGRFARWYAEHYGELPSETLRAAR